MADKVTVTNAPTADMVAMQPQALVAAALERGADPAVLEKLLALQERWEAGQAVKAYNAAMAAFKSECPARLPKNKHVNFKNKAGIVTDYWHTTLDKVVEVVQPILAKNGLSHSWRTTREGREVVVTCRISHVAGHYEETMLAGEPDTSGGKNPVQTVGSTTTYLQRYTLLSLLGLATYEEEDTDGRPPSNGRREPPPQQNRKRIDPDEPTRVMIAHLEQCCEAASGMSGEKAANIAAEIKRCVALYWNGEKSAQWLGVFYGNVQAGLKRLGWKRPPEWDEQRKERRAAAKAEQEELHCDPETGEVDEPPLQEPPYMDDEEEAAEREPGEDED